MANGLEEDLLNIGFYLRDLEDQIATVSRLLPLPERQGLTEDGAKRVIAYLQSIALRNYVATNVKGFNPLSNHGRTPSGVHAQYSLSNGERGPDARSISELFNLVYVDGRLGVYYKRESQTGNVEEKSSHKDLDVRSKLITKTDPNRLDELCLMGSQDFLYQTQMDHPTSIVNYTGNLSWEEIYDMERFTFECLAALEELAKEGISAELVSVRKVDYYGTSRPEKNLHHATIKLGERRTSFYQNADDTLIDLINKMRVRIDPSRTNLAD
ncbi:MAG: hypothetical protein U0R17_00725 [Acidimicrobiia bacterium]